MKAAHFIPTLFFSIIALYVLGVGPAAYISIKAPQLAAPILMIYQPLIPARRIPLMRAYIDWWCWQAGVING